MPLYSPEHSSSMWIYDNWGANPSATIGTNITSGSANSKGSWTSIATGSNINRHVYAMYLQLHTGSTATTLRPLLFDVGIDPAGGTSYTTIIPNVLCGNSPALTAAGNREFYFPIRIPKGSQVAIRSQSVGATNTRFAARFYGELSRPEMFPYGFYADSFGADEASSQGTSITPGNATDGAWTLIGTTSRPIWWWQLGYQIWNTTITAEYTYLDLGYGDGTAAGTKTIFRMMHGGTTSETCGLAAQTHLLSIAAYTPVPAGRNIYVRGRTNNAPDSGYQVAAIGIGG